MEKQRYQVQPGQLVFTPLKFGGSIGVLLSRSPPRYLGDKREFWTIRFYKEGHPIRCPDKRCGGGANTCACCVTGAERHEIVPLTKTDLAFYRKHGHVKGPVKVAPPVKLPTQEVASFEPI